MSILSSYAGYHMKYHTTVLNIIVSLCILLGVFVLVLALASSAMLPPIGNALIDNLIASIQVDNGEFELSVGRIDGALFKAIKLYDIQLNLNFGDESTPFLLAESVTIDLPAYRLLFPKRLPKLLRVTVASPHVTVDNSIFEFLSSLYEQEPETIKEDSIFENLSYTFSITNGKVQVALKDFEIETAEINASLDFSGGADLEQGTVSLSHTVFNTTTAPDNSVTLDEFSASLGKTSDGSSALIASAAGLRYSIGLYDLHGVLESVTGSFSSPSNKDLFSGNGKFVMDVGNLSLDTSLEKFPISAEVVSAIAEMSMNGFLPSQILVTTKSTGIDIFSLFEQKISIKVPTLDGEIAFTSNTDLTGSFETSGTVDVLMAEESVLIIDSLNASGSLSEHISSLRLGWKRLDYSPHECIEELFPLDISMVNTLQLSDAYIQFISNTMNLENQLELSFSLQSDTDIKHFEQFQVDLIGDISLSEDFSILQTSILADNLIASGIPGKSSIDLDFSQKTVEPATLGVMVSHDAGILLLGNYDFGDDLIRATLRLEDLKPVTFALLITEYFPGINPYYDRDTSIEGNASATFSSDLQTGRGAAELAVTDFSLDGNPFNFASTISGNINPERILIDSATLTTEGLRITYQGILDRQSFLPGGNLLLGLSDTGETVLSVDFSISGESSYAYDIFSPMLSDVRLFGSVKLEPGQIIHAQADLLLPTMNYPLDIIADLNIGLFKLMSPGLLAQLDIVRVPGHIDIMLETDRFPLPELSTSFVDGKLLSSGKIAMDYSLGDGLFIISSDEIFLEGLSWFSENPWELSFSLLADPFELRLSDLSYRDTTGKMQGNGLLKSGNLLSLIKRDFTDFSAIFELESEIDPTESIRISLFNESNELGIVRGFFSIDSLKLSRLNSSFSPYILNFSALGSSDLSEHIDLHLSASLGHDSTDANLIRGDLEAEINNNAISIKNSNFSSGIYSITGLKMVLPYSGVSQLEAFFTVTPALSWRDTQSRVGVSIETALTPANNFFTFIPVLVEATQSPVNARISISDVQLLGGLSIPDGSYDITYDTESISIFGGKNTNLNGFYRFTDGYLQLKATEDFLMAFNAKGFIQKDYISLLVDSIAFPITHMNTLIENPIIPFHAGVAFGEIRIEGELANPKYYGTIWANRVDAGVFFAPRENISLMNPVLTISENRVTLPKTPITSFGTEGKVVSGYLSLETALERWDFPNYRVDVSVPDDPIFIWIPIVPKDINIETMVSGQFSIEGTATAEKLTGNVQLSNGIIGFGVPELPVWFKVVDRTSLDMTLTTGKNLSFVYPNLENPILLAAIADDQSIRITLDAPSQDLQFEGALSIRSGEIYYVQKNFYITEGSLLFKAAVGAGASEINPLVNLRARLREFDSDGNRIDIFLVLQDSTLDNLVPRFESSPFRSTNEILEILGQGIIPGSSFEETTLGSVVAIATVATDVFSRLGIIDGAGTTYGFSQIIRNSLGLDVFTIRTNLLQNILFGAIPGASTSNTVSPIARYLDNTTLYLGKYLFNDFYLQGLLHFRGDLYSSGRISSFLSDDLVLDTEFSLEWTTPLAFFSLFTQPDVLSVFNIFDTIGFSITKRIVF
jgi:hypothetical protein